MYQWSIGLGLNSIRAHNRMLECLSRLSVRIPHPLGSGSPHLLKSLPKTKIHKLDDNDAINAGNIRDQYHSHYRLSLVDCFLITVAKANNAKIITTDHSVRDVARKMKVNVDYLPLLK